MSEDPTPPRKRSSKNRLPAESVTIDFVILGDFAQVANGKLTIVGGGWTIFTPPAPYPTLVPFGVGIGILVPWQETNRPHRFEFAIRGQSQEVLFGGGGDFEVGRQLGIRPGMTQRVTIGFSGQLTVNEAGIYEIKVESGDARKIVTFDALPFAAAQLGSGRG